MTDARNDALHEVMVALEAVRTDWDKQENPDGGPRCKMWLKCVSAVADLAKAKSETMPDPMQTAEEFWDQLDDTLDMRGRATEATIRKMEALIRSVRLDERRQALEECVGIVRVELLREQAPVRRPGMRVCRQAMEDLIAKLDAEVNDETS